LTNDGRSPTARIGDRWDPRVPAVSIFAVLDRSRACAETREKGSSSRSDVNDTHAFVFLSS